MAIDVVCVAIVRDGLLLACRRAGTKTLGGFWELPGGKVEIGEGLEIALRRELKEELNFTPGQLIPLLPSSNSDQIALHAFITFTDESDITFGDDHDQIAWVNSQELVSLKWAPLDLPHLEKIQGFLR